MKNTDSWRVGPRNPRWNSPARRWADGCLCRSRNEL